jgi:hypothetical protein
MWTSIDSSNFALCELLDELDRLEPGACSRSRSTAARAAVTRLPWRGHQPTTSTPIERAVPAMIFAAASTSLAFRSASLVVAISRSWAWVILPTLLRCGSARALLEADRLADQIGGRRRLCNKGERAVLVDGDHDRDHGAGVLLGLRVERLAELHDVDAVLAERRTDRRRRRGGAAKGLQLDRGEDFFAMARAS